MLVLDGYFDEIDISKLPPDFVKAKFDKLKVIFNIMMVKRSRYHFEREYKISKYIPNKLPNNPIGDFDGVLYFTKIRKTGEIIPLLKVQYRLMHLISNLEFYYIEMVLELDPMVRLIL